MQSARYCLQRTTILRYAKSRLLINYKLCTTPTVLGHAFKSINHLFYRLCHRPNIVQFSNLIQKTGELDRITYEKVCDETLESLTEYFEQLIEESDNLEAADASYSSGVLTIQLGKNHGTYVINRQSPNKQIWLSSPISGPKRYDFLVEDNYWIYKHDGQSLHALLQSELSKIVDNVDFSKCTYSKL